MVSQSDDPWRYRTHKVYAVDIVFVKVPVVMATPTDLEDIVLVEGGGGFIVDLATDAEE